MNSRNAWIFLRVHLFEGMEKWEYKKGFSFPNLYLIGVKKWRNRNCKDSIRNDPRIILGSYVKRAQTISLVERRFKKLGLDHWTVVRVGSGQRISFEESRELYALIILLVSRTPWLGGRVVPPLSHTASLILLYWHLSSHQRPRISSIS